MSASLDEASYGFNIDAPNSLSTNFYLLIGGNAYGLSSSASDYDAYRLYVNIGHTYTVTSVDSTSYGYPTNTNFNVYASNGNLIGSSTDYGSYSGFTFSAYYSYYI